MEICCLCRVQIEDDKEEVGKRLGWFKKLLECVMKKMYMAKAGDKYRRLERRCED